jgi:hypothetical protein
MKKNYTFFILLLFASLFNRAMAQIVSFSFAGSSGDEMSWPSTAETSGVQPSSITRGPGVTATANADRFNSKGWTTGSVVDVNDYVEFTIIPKPGFAVTISTIALQHQRSVTGPKSFVIRTSLDDFAANATNEVNIPDVNTNQSSTFTFPSVISTTAPLVIRIYAYNSEAANGTWGPGESADGNDISISGSQINLPVKFVNVKAIWKDKQVEINWSNATESDILYYTVERSANGQHFTELTRVAPVKNNNGQANYKSIDVQPLSKVNFYRIKAVEASGHILYSIVVKIEIGFSGTSLALYPNPATSGSQLMVQLNNLDAGNYKLMIYNSVAQLLHQQTITVSGTSLSQSLPLNNFQKGMYILKISGAASRQQQFIVQ